MTREEYDELLKTTADNLSRVVNAGCRQDIDKFAELMINDHRTLIQIKMGLCVKFMELLLDQYAHGYFDGRNEYACKIAKRMLDAVEPFERQMPLI
jgi:hypothetical protein